MVSQEKQGDNEANLARSIVFLFSFHRKPGMIKALSKCSLLFDFTLQTLVSSLLLICGRYLVTYQLMV